VRREALCIPESQIACVYLGAGCPCQVLGIGLALALPGSISVMNLMWCDSVTLSPPSLNSPGIKTTYSWILPDSF
jgi:hypothetical protein